MMISLIVAAANNNVIAKDGQMPWRQSEDLKYFKNVTWGMPVIMGRKSFQALGKPLEGRKNIVITRQTDWKPEGAMIAGSLEEATIIAGETDAKEVFVIGGGEIYWLALEKANRVYLTRIKAEPEGDVFFPELNTEEWKLISSDDHEADNKNQYAYSFQTWERKKI